MFKKRSLLLVILPALTFSPSLIMGENLADPMRPPAVGGRASVSADANAPRWQVTAILISSGRRLAMVNNRLLAVGSTVDGARIKAIYGNSVELDIGDRALVIHPAVPTVRRLNEELK